MDYSAINKLIYTIGLKPEMFVIGGTFAAAMCEPACAKMMGMSSETLHVYISSSNFEVLKGYTGKATEVLEVQGDKIILRDRYWNITFERGIPAAWKTKNGHQVMDPAPLKQWLMLNGHEGYAQHLQDKPFEQRMEGWELTEAETAFKKACAGHDWYSDYSDDASVRRNAAAELEVLKKQRDELGGHAKAIFDHYSSK